MTEQPFMLEQFKVEQRIPVPHTSSVNITIIKSAYSGGPLRPRSKLFEFRLPDDVVSICHDTLTNSPKVLTERSFRIIPAADVITLRPGESFSGYPVIIPSVISDQDWRMKMVVVTDPEGKFAEARLVFDCTREFERAGHESITIAPEEFEDWQNSGQAKLRHRLETIFRPSIYLDYLDKAAPGVRNEIEELMEFANKHLPKVNT